ncbi:winged helix DNA-binding domain-containing protein [Nocardioides sp. Arc9.136]|uniref:winged helix DNA-binding domain-containing protein n=1 Tax=Nocardioides sp. Arc9.136 TaxID=2996826 RepID=UPI002665BD6E|nr:winged helix DNA-binding domain-containing protein [Nocardioides sp. Arc9.136]WKN50363.1 winged helix DNA-binding domain-containing protein [Nocardioides sp. Arc9.136]
MTSSHDIARWRFATQHLTAPHAGSATDVVAGLLAVQAENPTQAAWAVAARTSRPDGDDLAGLLSSGAVLRTHVLRPTWHFVAAADVAWLLELTAPRVRPTLLRQLTDTGWTTADLGRATGAVLDALGGAGLTRDGVRTALAERDVTVTGHELMLLLGLTELDRLVCSGPPTDDGTHTYALMADRVPPAPARERDEALAELARRYVAGHGPATDRDLAYWATLPLGDVRRGLAGAADHLERFEHEGRTYWHAAGTAPPAAGRQPGGHLLQILDETYRGFQDSRMLIDVAGVVPGGRETAIGMAVVDAQLVGRMRRTLGARARFDVVPYRPLGTAAVRALQDAADRYAAFLGLEPDLRLADG